MMTSLSNTNDPISIINSSLSVGIEEVGMPRLGYACINNTLNYPKPRKDTTCRITSAYNAGAKTGCDPETEEYSKAMFNFLTRYGLKNTAEVIEILQWHAKVKLCFYRLSSDLFPHIDNDLLRFHMTSDDIDEYRSLAPFKQNIQRIAEIAYLNKIRITTHPDPYTVLASPDMTKVETSIRTLTWHSLLFEIMDAHIESLYKVKDAFKDSILCLHIGGRYDKLGGKVGTVKRWAKNFKELLPEYVQKRICIENCEKNCNAEDLLPLCEELKIPLIFDFHHYDCYPIFHKDEKQQLPTHELLPRIIQTWLVRGMRPKFHLSDQAPNLNTGAHDQFVKCIPTPLLLLAKEQKIAFDIMIEAKAKDYAVFYLLAKYPFLNQSNITDPYSLIHKQYPGVPDRPEIITLDSITLLADTSVNKKSTSAETEITINATNNVINDNDNVMSNADTGCSCCLDSSLHKSVEMLKKPIELKMVHLKPIMMRKK